VRNAGAEPAAGVSSPLGPVDAPPRSPYISFGGLGLNDEPQGWACDDVWEGKSALQFRVLVNFHLFLALQTTYAANGSDKTYVSQQEFDWSYNGSGTVNSTTLKWTALPGITGDFSDPDFRAVTHIMIAGGVSMNEFYKTHPGFFWS
jgi:hypothetical protein